MTRCPIDRSPIYSELGELKCLASAHSPRQWAAYLARTGAEAPSRPVTPPRPLKPCNACGGPTRASSDGTPYCERCRAKQAGAREGTNWGYQRTGKPKPEDYLKVW